MKSRNLKYSKKLCSWVVFDDLGAWAYRDRVKHAKTIILPSGVDFEKKWKILKSTQEKANHDLVISGSLQIRPPALFFNFPPSSSTSASGGKNPLARAQSLARASTNDFVRKV